MQNTVTLSCNHSFETDDQHEWIKRPANVGLWCNECKAVRDVRLVEPTARTRTAEWYAKTKETFELNGIRVGSRSWCNDSSASVFSYDSAPGTLGHPKYESHFLCGRQVWSNLPI